MAGLGSTFEELLKIIGASMDEPTLEAYLGNNLYARYDKGVTQTCTSTYEGTVLVKNGKILKKGHTAVFTPTFNEGGSWILKKVVIKNVNSLTMDGVEQDPTAYPLIVNIEDEDAWFFSVTSGSTLSSISYSVDIECTFEINASLQRATTRRLAERITTLEEDESRGIIDVDELPTTDINKNALYRINANTVFGGIVGALEIGGTSIPVKVIVVDGKPEVGVHWEDMDNLQAIVYLDLSDGKSYIYNNDYSTWLETAFALDDFASGGAGVVSWGGIITSASEATDPYALYIIYDGNLYHRIDDAWVKTGGESSGGMDETALEAYLGDKLYAQYDTDEWVSKVEAVAGPLIYNEVSGVIDEAISMSPKINDLDMRIVSLEQTSGMAEDLIETVQEHSSEIAGITGMVESHMESISDHEERISTLEQGGGGTSTASSSPVLIEVTSVRNDWYDEEELKFVRVNVRVISGTLQEGDELQLCNPVKKKMYHKDEDGNKINVRIKQRFCNKCSETILAQDIERVNAGGTLTLRIPEELYYKIFCYTLNASGGAMKAPRVLRIVRTNDKGQKIQISNSVRVVHNRGNNTLKVL